MATITSSPEFQRRENDSSLNFRKGREEKVTVSASEVQTRGLRPTVEFVSGFNLYYEEPSGLSTWEGRNLASSCHGGVTRNYSSIYHSFDARNHFKTETYDYELDVQCSQPQTHCKTDPCSDPYAETTECNFDVKCTENRVNVPLYIKLKPLTIEGITKGLRGYAFLENKTGLNLTFFIKPSSPLIHVKETVDWLLPYENFKVHIKTFAEYHTISREFLLIYVYPIYFPEQLDMIKLREFWSALGSDLAPVERMQCYRIDKLLLSRTAHGKYSMLDWVRNSGSCIAAPPLVQTHPGIEVKDHPGYQEFWNLKDEDMDIAKTCYMRETKILRRRNLQQNITERKWHHIFSSGIVLVLCTAIIVKYLMGFVELPSEWQSEWKGILPSSLMEPPSLQIKNPIPDPPSPGIENPIPEAAIKVIMADWKEILPSPSLEDILQPPPPKIKPVPVPPGFVLQEEMVKIDQSSDLMVEIYINVTIDPEVDPDKKPWSETVNESENVLKKELDEKPEQDCINRGKLTYDPFVVGQCAFVKVWEMLCEKWKTGSIF